MSRAEVRSRVIDALAHAKRRDPADLEAELLLAGSECPFDSIYLVRVAVRVARQLGFKLKPSQSIAHYFKSVEGVTTLLHEIARREAA
jgi:acyl carrier protein